jgi:hypothetical protein
MNIWWTLIFICILSLRFTLMSSASDTINIKRVHQRLHPHHHPADGLFDQGGRTCQATCLPFVTGQTEDMKQDKLDPLVGITPMPSCQEYPYQTGTNTFNEFLNVHFLNSTRIRVRWTRGSALSRFRSSVCHGADRRHETGQGGPLGHITPMHRCATVIQSPTSTQMICRYVGHVGGTYISARIQQGHKSGTHVHTLRRCSLGRENIKHKTFFIIHQ